MATASRTPSPGTGSTTWVSGTFKDRELLGHYADLVIVDMHAEATSEAQAMGYHLEGRAAAVLGTHTHVPTLDTKVLAGGTAYVTDIGMTGPYDGVIGMKKEASLGRFLKVQRPRYEVAEGDLQHRYLGI